MIEENPWPIEVLVEIFKWFSIEERLKQLAPVCKLFHQAVHTPKFWKIVDTNSEFTLSSFHSVFGHAKHITHLGFRYSQRQLGCRNLIENALNDCVNLVHLDLAYNTSIFTLFFIQSMPFLRYLDITSCQNVKETSLTLSLKNKRGLQVLKMGNCFQIEGNSLVSIIRSLPDVRNVVANWCGSITVEQARDVLQHCKLLAFSFSPCWGPPNLWEEFVQDFKHVEFGEDLLDHVKRVHLPGFLYDEEVE